MFNSILLHGQIKGFADSKISLLKYNNSKLFTYEIADSIVTDSEGRFALQQPATSGMYRICQGKAG